MIYEEFLFNTLLWVKPWLILCVMILVQGFVVLTDWREDR